MQDQQDNFLTNPKSQPHVKATDIAEYFFTFPLSHLWGLTESVLGERLLDFLP